jgi:hypothetical protein
VKSQEYLIKLEKMADKMLRMSHEIKNGLVIVARMTILKNDNEISKCLRKQKKADKISK